jgi:hypothetical protein
MKLSELYPYWADSHHDLLETVAILSPAQIDARSRAGAASIREILLDFLLAERFGSPILLRGMTMSGPAPIIIPMRLR